MSVEQSPLTWVPGYLRREPGKVPNTYVATYSLDNLIGRGLIPAEEGHRMLEESGLSDFTWKVTWPEDYETPDEYLTDRIDNVQGYVIFVHGWTGNSSIWEQLPGLTVSANRRLVALAIDHNGFGESPFVSETPSLSACNPPAAMRTIERWIDLIKIRRQPGQRTQKVINLVGHSMGGATLFYLNPIMWNYGEVTRCTLAPALLLEDELYRAFYTTLGIGIGVLQRVRFLEFVERFIKPTMVRSLCSGASDFVKGVHDNQYDVTARGVTGATFLAMGQLKDFEIARDWSLFRVMLGHRDRLVGLTGMMDLLCKLEFPAANIRVVAGTHYMFSIGSEDSHNAFQHAQNRELVVRDILTLHQQAIEMQRAGQRIG
jgi:pimeloyl-ACP methyl ester carboxylesterase